MWAARSVAIRSSVSLMVPVPGGRYRIGNAPRGGGLQRAPMRTGVDGVDLERFQPLRQTFGLLTAQGAQRWIRNVLEPVVDVRVPNEPDLRDALDANQVRVLERTHRADDVVGSLTQRSDIRSAARLVLAKLQPAELVEMNL